MKKIRHGRELEGYPFNLRALVTRGIIVAQRNLFGGGGGGEHVKSGWFKRRPMAPLDYDATGEAAQALIRSALEAPTPCMIGRFGSGEMEATLRYLDIHAPGSVAAKLFRMATGKSGPFWWDNSIRAGITWIAGLYPETDDILNRFGARVTEDCRQLDLLGGWVPGERRMHDAYFPNAKTIPLWLLEPFTAAKPWTSVLAGKKVLVVHPFAATIESQYVRREKLFRNPAILPAFELKTYRSVVSLAGERPPWPTWFEALDHMCADIAEIDFDVALIGAGAYGMSIAAFVKRELKRKAVHRRQLLVS